MADLVRRAWSRTTPGPSTSTRSTATTARTRPRARPARSTRSRRSTTSRASSSCPTTSSGPATTRSMRRAAFGCWPTTHATARASGRQTCDGFPCLVLAKSDAEVFGIRPALQHPNVTLLTRARALRLGTNAAGTAVEQVVVERDGAEETYRADIVVVSAGAANSAKLLLASANDRHPNGLANGSGQVGRNYMFHNSVAVLAISKEPNPTMFQKTLGRQRLLLRDEGLRLPDGQHPDGRQVRRARCSRARSRSRPSSPRCSR